MYILFIPDSMSITPKLFLDYGGDCPMKKFDCPGGLLRIEDCLDLSERGLNGSVLGIPIRTAELDQVNLTAACATPMTANFTSFRIR